MLAAYIRVWSLAMLTRLLTPPGRELLYNMPVMLATICVATMPLMPAILVLTFVVRIFASIASMPYLHDSQHWCLQTDLAMLLAIAATLSDRYVLAKKTEKVEGKARLSFSLLAPFTKEEADSVASRAAATVRFQFVLFYFSAALFKMNDGFMHKHFSCAPIYIAQLLEANIPARWLWHEAAHFWLNLAISLAPSLVLAVEIAVPLLMLVDMRVGTSLGAIFHTLIAITPPPNDIAGFGTQTLPRLLLLVPSHSAAASAVASLAEPGLRSLFVISFAAVATMLQPGPFDLAVPVCAGMTALVLEAAVSSSKHPVLPGPQGKRRVGIAGWALRVLAMAYALVFIPLGLQDMGSANMFSSLRMHGGSNHWFLPTGLLQRIFADFSPSTSVFGEAFGGGIVRIESTNSSFFSRDPNGLRYPGELTQHTHAAVQLLKKYGHSGRQWSPMAFQCPLGNHPSLAEVGGGCLGGGGGTNARGNVTTADVAPNFDPYTLPAAEVRRLLRESYSRHPDESFDIAGALLPGTDGDEDWRANAAAVNGRFLLRRRPHLDGGGGSWTCINTDTQDEVCPDWVIETLLSPPSHRWFPMFVRKVLLSQPYPVIFDDTGPHKMLHCFGP